MTAGAGRAGSHDCRGALWRTMQIPANHAIATPAKTGDGGPAGPAAMTAGVLRTCPS